MEINVMDVVCRYMIKEKSDIRSVVGHLLEDVKNSHAVSEQKEFEIKLVMNELLSNCFKYCKISAKSPVIVEYMVEKKQLHFTVCDCGTGFNVREIDYKNLDIASDQQLFAENGRGLFLANQLSHKLRFNEKGNQVTAIIDLV
jgi:anti-sigma regulatory factor (Ser/Thr protein kinase)